MKNRHVISSFVTCICELHVFVNLSEWVIVAKRLFNNCSAMSWREQVSFQWADVVRFVVDQHA